MSYNLSCVLPVGVNAPRHGDNLGFVPTSGADCGASFNASQINALDPWRATATVIATDSFFMVSGCREATCQTVDQFLSAGSEDFVISIHSRNSSSARASGSEVASGGIWPCPRRASRW